MIYFLKMKQIYLSMHMGKQRIYFGITRVSFQNHQNSDELFDVILRLLKSEKVGIKSTSKITLGKFLLVTKNNHIEISIKSETLSLPLVRSDLMSPGFSDSHFQDSMNCH